MPFDLLDKWRDEDYWFTRRDEEVGGDTLAGAGQFENGTRQVRVPPAHTLLLFVVAFTLYALNMHV